MNYYSEEQVREMVREAAEVSNPSGRDHHIIVKATMKTPPSLALPAPGEPWEPDQMQQYCERIGFPYLCMDKNGDWHAFLPTPMISGERWVIDLMLPIVEDMPVYATIAYTGDWKDSLRGPKTAWKPCGEGENICNCKGPDECGYKAMDAELRKLEEDGAIPKGDE